jgi:hypothetical protein
MAFKHDVLSFRGTDCNTDHHYLVVAKVTERLAVSKEAVKMDMERFSVNNLNEGKLMNCVRLQTKTSFQL